MPMLPNFPLLQDNKLILAFSYQLHLLSFKPLPTAFPQRSLGFHKSCLKAQFIHFEALPSSTCCPIIKLMLLVGFSYGSTPFPNIKICSGYWLLHSKPLQHLVKIAVIYCAYKSAIWGGLGKDSSFLPQVVSTGATSLGAGESILQVSPYSYSWHGLLGFPHGVWWGSESRHSKRTRQNSVTFCDLASEGNTTHTGVTRLPVFKWRELSPLSPLLKSVTKVTL